MQCVPTHAVISEGLRFPSHQPHARKGGVCSSHYNGAFVLGHGERAATETAAAFDRARPPWAPVALVYHPATRQQVTRYHSEPVAACRMIQRRDANDWTSGEDPVATGKWDKLNLHHNPRVATDSRHGSRRLASARRERRVFPEPSTMAPQRCVSWPILLCHHVTQSPVIYTHTRSVCRVTSGTNSRSSASTSCLKADFNPFFPLINPSNHVVVWLHHSASLMPVKAPILPLPGLHFIPPWGQR